jgi:hypothetical protein
VAVPRPITAKDRAAVRRLHGEGMTRNDIARKLKRSPSTVSKLAAEAGLTFDRAAETAVATAVRSADLAARRADLAARLHDDAERLREQLFAPCVIGSFGGKENVWTDQALSRPPFADQRQIMGATAVAIDKSLKLAPPLDDNGATEVGALLTGLFDALRDKHGG